MNEQGQCLLTRRQSHQDFADHWEFPGGKVESGESMEAALKRELSEEVGIEPVAPLPWLTIPWQYSHKKVCLHVFSVAQWDGCCEAKESQLMAWFELSALGGLVMPAANAVIVGALLHDA